MDAQRPRNSRILWVGEGEVYWIREALRDGKISQNAQGVARTCKTVIESQLTAPVWTAPLPELHVPARPVTL